MIIRNIAMSAASVLVLLVAVPAMAEPVGTVAEVDGQAEIGRGGAWLPATVGLAIEVGDTLRTGRPGRLRAVFQDESVIVLGDDSQLIVVEHVFAPDQGVFRSFMRLVSGKLRALASDYYQRIGASYQVETVTAVAGVRGTQFIVNVAPSSTEIVGIDGVVAVNSLDDSPRRAVLVTAQEMTIVVRGQLPTAPRQLTPGAFQQYLQGVGFVGGETLSRVHRDPSLTGGTVPAPDRATGLSATAPVTAPRITRDRIGPDASSLVSQPPAAVKALGRLRIPF